MKFLLVGNAPFFLAPTAIRAYARDKRVIGLDGACEKLRDIGLMPDVILGDFDSVSLESLDFFELQGVEMVRVHDQNLTDTVKAIQYCDRHGAESIDIICATSGRMDQTINNCRILRSQYKKNRPILLHTENQTLTFAKDETITMRGRVGDYCGLFAFPAGNFTSTGLRYNGNKYPLHFGYAESACNQLAEPMATILVEGEVLIVHPLIGPEQAL